MWLEENLVNESYKWVEEEVEEEEEEKVTFKLRL